MENQKKFRVLTLIGVFALLAVSLSSCFYGGYGYRDRYYSRPSYGYGYPQPRYQTRVYVAPQRRYYSHNDNHYRNNNSRNRSYQGNSRNGHR